MTSGSNVETSGTSIEPASAQTPPFGREGQETPGCHSVHWSAWFLSALLLREECPREDRELHNFYHPVVTSCHDIHSPDGPSLPFL